MTSFTRPIISDVKLFESGGISTERDRMEKLADLYEIVRATEALETAYSRDAVKLEEYREACTKLISQFKNKEASLITSKYIQSADDYFKSNKYDISYASAYNRLVIFGIPQNVVHPVHDSKKEDKSSILEMGASFVTGTIVLYQSYNNNLIFIIIIALDVIRMNPSKDNVHPQLGELLVYLGAMHNLPPDFDGIPKLRKWIERLNQMKASENLQEDQVRELIFDVEATYNTVKRCL
jgi:ESCRT-I complex subunit VPS28